MIEKIKENIKVLMESNSRELDKLKTQNHCFEEFLKILEGIQKEQKDIKDDIKKIIDELNHNIEVDKDNDETLISGVSCDYVIERLKDIIK